MFSRNTKLKKSSVYTVSFDLEPVATCPFAGECKRYCYGCKGHYRTFAKTLVAYWAKGMKAARSADFVGLATAALAKLRKVRAVRWHATGDFWAPEYLSKVLEVARLTPSLQHYAYTKSVAMVKAARQRGEVPANFTFIFSLGGKQDALVSLCSDRHARIFESKEALEQAGYDDCSENDALAWSSNSNNIGLVAH